MSDMPPPAHVRRLHPDAGPSDPELPPLRITAPRNPGGLRRHFSEGAPPLLSSWRTPRAAVTPPPPDVRRRAPGAGPSTAQHELQQVLDALRAQTGSAAPTPRGAVGPGPTATDAAFVARVRELAPELMHDDMPITAGAAVVGPNGTLFDGAREGTSGLEARLQGAPLIPCLAADAMLGYLESTANPTPAQFAAVAAEALSCPIGLGVPAVMVTARDGHTYGSGALARHLATQRHAGRTPSLPMSRETQLEPLPPPNRSLMALAARLDLVAAEGAAAEAEAQAEAAALAAMPLERYGSDDFAALFSLLEHPIEQLSSLAISPPPTAVAIRDARVVFGEASGELTLMAATSGESEHTWQAHRAATGGRGGVAQVALSEREVVSLGGFAPGHGIRASVPKVWSLAGELLRRLEPPLPAAITSLHFAGRGVVAAATASGAIASWRYSPGLARTPRFDRQLGEGVVIGLADGAEGTAVVDGARLELSTPDGVRAGRLAGAVGAVRTVLPCGNAVVLLDEARRVHLYAEAAEASPGWPAGSLAPRPLPPLLGDRAVELIAAGDTLWAAAAADGAIAVLQENGAVLDEIAVPHAVTHMALHAFRLGVITANQDFFVFETSLYR